MKLTTIFCIIIYLSLYNSIYAQVAGTPVRIINTDNISTTFSSADLKALPQTTLRVKGEDDALHDYTGVDILVLLAKAKVRLSIDVKHQTLMSYMQITGADNYSVIYALPEIDSLFSDKKMILANLKDGKPLPDNFGPLQIITTGEKKHARLIRQVVKIEIKKA